MKSQTIQSALKIQPPPGFEIEFDASNGLIKFNALQPQNYFDALRHLKPLEIKTVEDLLGVNGLNVAAFDEQCKDLPADEKAYRLIKMLTKTLNQDWTPDWDDEDQIKYVAWFYMGGSSGFLFHDYDVWYSDSNVGSRLCFKSSELAEHAGKHFTAVYKQFMLIP